VNARTPVRGLLARRRTAVAVLAGALLLAFASASVSSASALSLIGGKAPTSQSQSRCTAQAVAVTTTATGTTSSVTASNLDVAHCTGKLVSVTVYDPSAATWAAAKKLEATATINAASMALTSTGSFTPNASQKVHVTIGGWPVTGTWTYAPPTAPLVSCTALNNPALTCTATLSDFTSWGYPAATDYNAYFTVTSPSATTNVEWQITINLSHAAFPFVARSMTGNNQEQLASGWSCAQLPLLVLTGQVGSNTALVGGGKQVITYLNGHSTAAAGGSLFVCP